MSRNYQAGDAYHKTFPVNDGTGAKVNFDASPAPTATFIRNGVADPTVLTITLLSGKTGAYDVSGTIPGAAGDLIDTYVEGSIGGTPTNGVVESFRVVSWPSNVLPNAAANSPLGLPILDASSRLETDLQTIKGQAVTATASVTFPAVISSYTGGAVTLANGSITTATFAAGAIDANAFAQAAADKVWATTTRILTAGTNIVLVKGTGITGLNDITAGAVWDEPLTATSHNGVTSAGRILRLINPNSDVIHTGTARVGSTSTTIVLDNAASANDAAYNYDVISLTGGTGGSQSRVITGYVGATKTATIDSPWSITPDATTTFDITPSARALVIGYEAGVNPATLILDAVATDHATTGTIGADIIAAAAGGGGSGPTAAEIATAILTDTTASDLAIAGSLGHLVGNAPAWYTAPDNTDIATLITSVGSDLGTAVAAIKTQTDKFLFDTSDFVKSNPQASITVGDVTLAADQPNYAPARAGDPMALSDDWLDSAATFRDQRTVTAPTNRDLLQGAYGIYTPLVKDDATGNFNVVSPLDNAVILYTYSGDDAMPAVLTAAGLDAIMIESGVNARQAIALNLAACAGLLSGAGTGTIVINGGNVSTTRITATTDNLGNRTAITLNVPA